MSEDDDNDGPFLTIATSEKILLVSKLDVHNDGVEDIIAIIEQDYTTVAVVYFTPPDYIEHEIVALV